MKQKILSMLCLGLVFGLSNAEAAKLKQIDPPTSQALNQVHSAWLDLCELFGEWERAGMFDCDLSAFEIVSRSRSEKWENTIKQSIHISVGSGVTQAKAKNIANTNLILNQQVDSLLATAEYDGSDSELNIKIKNMKASLKKEIANKSGMMIFEGGFDHNFGYGSTLTIVDMENGEILSLSIVFTE